MTCINNYMLYKKQPAGPARRLATYIASRVRPKTKISCAAAQIAATLTISFLRWRHISSSSYWGQQRMSLASYPGHTRVWMNSPNQWRMYNIYNYLSKIQNKRLQELYSTKLEPVDQWNRPWCNWNIRSGATALNWMDWNHGYICGWPMLRYKLYIVCSGSIVVTTLDWWTQRFLVRVPSGCQYSMRLDRLHRAYPSLHIFEHQDSDWVWIE